MALQDQKFCRLCSNGQLNLLGKILKMPVCRASVCGGVLARSAALKLGVPEGEMHFLGGTNPSPEREEWAALPRFHTERRNKAQVVIIPFPLEITCSL